MRDALDVILHGHEPYPAVAVDRTWNLVAANSPMYALTAVVDVDPALLEPPINVMRVGLHPRGLAPLMVNLGDWHAHWLDRLERQLAGTGDEELAALIEEIAGYPVPEPERDRASGLGGSEILGPVRMHGPGGGELSFFGMFATFDTPFEVTTSELAIELLFPADRAPRRCSRTCRPTLTNCPRRRESSEEPNDLDQVRSRTAHLRHPGGARPSHLARHLRLPRGRQA